MLTDSVCRQPIHALVTVPIDYCNSLLYDLHDCSLGILQRIISQLYRTY